MATVSMKCRYCHDCWVLSDKAKRPCPVSDSERHAFVKAVRPDPERAYRGYAEAGECRLCGGSGGVFCPMSVEGEGPHRY